MYGLPQTRFSPHVPFICEWTHCLSYYRNSKLVSHIFFPHSPNIPKSLNPKVLTFLNISQVFLIHSIPTAIDLTLPLITSLLDDCKSLLTHHSTSSLATHPLQIYTLHCCKSDSFNAHLSISSSCLKSFKDFL